MNRFLFITLAAFGLMQLTLAVPQFAPGYGKDETTETTETTDSNEKSVDGLMPANLVEPIVVEKPVCKDPDSVVASMDYLSGSISAVESMDISDADKIYRLQASFKGKRQELIALLQRLVDVLNVYQDACNQAAENATDKLQSMTDLVDDDMKAADFVEGKKNDLKGDKVVEACKKIDRADADIKLFNTTVEGYKTEYINAVTPNLEKIVNGVEDLTNNYNGDDADIEAAKKVIEPLIEVIQAETQAITANAEKNVNDFDEKCKVQGDNLQATMKNYFDEWQALLN